MSRILDSIRNRFARIESLPAGVHRYQSPPDSSAPYRLHLRLEKDGAGLLIVNASTVLHLNQTAAEYAHQLVLGAAPEEAARAIAGRYRVSRKQALQDFQDFTERLEALIRTPDLDPETSLGFEREDPYPATLSAPLRLDCALTYRLPDAAQSRYAPVERAPSELSTGEWKAILDKAWTAGIPHVVFTGGEPVLREDLAELIAHAEKLGQVTGLLSGSVRLADPAYLNGLLDAGLDHLMFLLQADDEESWAATGNAMAADLHTTVHLTLDRKSAARIPALLERLAGLQVKSLSLSAADPEGAEALLAARNRAAELGVTLRWDLPVPYSAANPVARETGGGSSGAGKAWLYVEPDGDVLPEQGITRVLGNLARDSWDAVWSAARA
jgi:MoaA/NifB/PqqE/SkfB family radical SAM enzyme